MTPLTPMRSGSTPALCGDEQIKHQHRLLTDKLDANTSQLCHDEEYLRRHITRVPRAIRKYPNILY